jgi:hypothetical protein
VRSWSTWGPVLGDTVQRYEGGGCNVVRRKAYSVKRTPVVRDFLVFAVVLVTARVYTALIVLVRPTLTFLGDQRLVCAGILARKYDLTAPVLADQHILVDGATRDHPRSPARQPVRPLKWRRPELPWTGNL